MSQEAPLIQGYLNLLVDLPWKISSTDKEDLNDVTKVLEKNHNVLKNKKKEFYNIFLLNSLLNP